MNPSNVEIRQFILDTFSEEDFELFCADYFPHAKYDFSDSMGFRLRTQKLIEYCQNREIVDKLVVALQKERQPAYTSRFGPATPTIKEVPETTQAIVRNPRQIFISHAHQDAEFAHRLAEDLRQRGWVPWITPDSLKPGEKWVAAIGRGLDESGVFLTLLTPAAIASAWVKNESDSAIDLEHEHQIRLIPLLVQQCSVPTLLRAYQRVSFIDDYGKGLGELLKTLGPSGRLSAGRIYGSQPYPQAHPVSVKTATQDDQPRVAPLLDGTARESVHTSKVREQLRAQRPASVTVTTILMIIGVFPLLINVITLSTILNSLMSSQKMFSPGSRNWVDWQQYINLALGGSVLSVVSVIVSIIVAIGLFRLQSTTRLGARYISIRKIALISAMVSIVSYVFVLVAALVVDRPELHQTYFAISLIGIGIEVVVIFGFNRKSVKQALQNA